MIGITAFVMANWLKAYQLAIEKAWQLAMRAKKLIIFLIYG